MLLIEPKAGQRLAGLKLETPVLFWEVETLDLGFAEVRSGEPRHPKPFEHVAGRFIIESLRRTPEKPENHVEAKPIFKDQALQHHSLPGQQSQLRAVKPAAAAKATALEANQLRRGVAVKKPVVGKKVVGVKQKKPLMGKKGSSYQDTSS
ncbi:hypothetical protein P7K49_002482 [Saguinus oedipus]|uniref:Uncharacterized protein n=1 Tax=Saguinus oedipus TaxID=9490 RepID=A0ABQ9WHI0_SAGOE|nr:hypothetical protein P7K49_002482 [Saguinus oedipus]